MINIFPYVSFIIGHKGLTQQSWVVQTVHILKNSLSSIFWTESESGLMSESLDHAVPI